MVNSTAESVMPTDFGHGGFAIYTDETSQSATKCDGNTTITSSAGASFEDSENLPPKLGAVLPSVANLQAHSQVALPAKVHNLEDKSR